MDELCDENINGMLHCVVAELHSESFRRGRYLRRELG
jgi:hypothetical protein